MTDQQKAGHDLALNAYADVWDIVTLKAVLGELYDDVAVQGELLRFAALPSGPAFCCATLFAARAIRDLAAARGVSVAEQVAELSQDVQLAALDVAADGPS